MPQPRKLPCINALYRSVAYLLEATEPAGIALENVAWRIHPAMWSQMMLQREYKQGGAIDIDHAHADKQIRWRMFGILVHMDTEVKHPTLTIAMDCIQEYDPS